MATPNCMNVFHRILPNGWYSKMVCWSFSFYQRVELHSYKLTCLHVSLFFFPLFIFALQLSLHVQIVRKITNICFFFNNSFIVFIFVFQEHFIHKRRISVIMLGHILTKITSKSPTSFHVYMSFAINLFSVDICNWKYVAFLIHSFQIKHDYVTTIQPIIGHYFILHYIIPYTTLQINYI